MSNPFTPTFGVTPPRLAGRRRLIDLFAESLDDIVGSPARATVYTGARGSGKTVLLNAVEDEARGRGWVVVSETATPGFVERLVGQQLPTLLGTHDPDARAMSLTGIDAPLDMGGASWTTTDQHPSSPGLRQQLTLLCELLAARGSGLLITLDEIHHRQVSELRDLTTALQHLMREGRQVAFAGAGIPSAVSGMLNDDVLTFLRRADRHVLGSVSFDEVVDALARPIVQFGRSIDDDAVRAAAQATGGYAFLIQLVGYHVWRQHPDRQQVTSADVSAGVRAARERLGTLVHEPSLADLSAVDQRFLLAMAEDDGPSSMSDVAARLGVDANYASQYRLRLIAAELISGVAHGRVDFTVPYLREHLREHPTASGLAPDPSTGAGSAP